MGWLWRMNRCLNGGRFKYIETTALQCTLALQDAQMSHEMGVLSVVLNHWNHDSLATLQVQCWQDRRLQRKATAAIVFKFIIPRSKKSWGFLLDRFFVGLY